MKKNNYKVLFVLIIIFTVSLINILMPRMKLWTMNNLYSCLLWLLIFGIILLFLGFEKSRSLYDIDCLQVVFIYTVIYLLATYIFGFFSGFIRSPYSLNILKIIANITPITLIIVMEELARFQLVQKAKAKVWLLITIALTFALFNISAELIYFNFVDAMSIFEFVGGVVLGNIIKNLLFVYIASKTSWSSNLLYRFMFEILIFLVPFFPNLGLYLELLLGIIFPVILLLKLNTFFAKYKPVARKARLNKLKSFLILAPTWTIIIVVFVLISGLFKIQAMAIISNSMVPIFQRGDMVVIEKIGKEEKRKLEVGDIIAYEYDKRIVTHRISLIKEDYQKFWTKGDNNDEVDDWEVYPNMIKGIVKYKIPFVGFPSVWLYELIK